MPKVTMVSITHIWADFVSAHVVLGSLWGFLMATGFMLSTLQPVLVIIKIFDTGRDIPERFFLDGYDENDS